MTIFSPCGPETPLSCEDKEALEAVEAQRAFAEFCNDVDLNTILRLLIFPMWASDPEDQRAALVHYLTRHEICHPSNNVGTDCDPEEPCPDPQPTYCPDPDECPSKFRGYGLLELIKSAIRADSMVRLPVKGLGSIASGEGLVWDPTAVPDNPDCDPCTADVAGAFTPQSLYDIAHPGG